MSTAQPPKKIVVRSRKERFVTLDTEDSTDGKIGYFYENPWGLEFLKNQAQTRSANAILEMKKGTLLVCSGDSSRLPITPITKDATTKYHRKFPHNPNDHIHVKIGSQELYITPVSPTPEGILAIKDAPLKRLRKLEEVWEERKKEGHVGANHLNPFLEDVGAPSFMHYIGGFLVDPLRMIQRGNKIIARNPNWPAEDIVDTVIELHEQITGACFSKDIPLENIDPTHYNIVHNVWTLADGDVLPGSPFILGKPEDFDPRRELLTLSRRHPLTKKAMRETKLFYVNALRQNKKGLIPLVHTMFENFQKAYSDDQDTVHLRDNAERMTIGPFMQDGGCCRHRAAALTHVLSEAGIVAQYIRGTLQGRPHAWVHVYEQQGDALPVLLADPNLHVDKAWQSKDMTCYDRGMMRPVSEEKIYRRENGWHLDAHGVSDPLNVVWRPKPRKDST